MLSKIKEIVLKIKVKGTRAKIANIYLEFIYIYIYTHLYLHRNIPVKYNTIHIDLHTHTNVILHILSCKSHIHHITRKQQNASVYAHMSMF